LPRTELEAGVGGAERGEAPIGLGLRVDDRAFRHEDVVGHLALEDESRRRDLNGLGLDGLNLGDDGRNERRRRCGRDEGIGDGANGGRGLRGQTGDVGRRCGGAFGLLLGHVRKPGTGRAEPGACATCTSEESKR